MSRRMCYKGMLVEEETGIHLKTLEGGFPEETEALQPGHGLPLGVIGPPVAYPSRIIFS
ncbi:hypothetical protein J2S74_003178 [Evansella vedderi]|uniref:Uncharacterized protein n=1 Tax=Evansella vedderi TaxID=38282 RepID=A0ABT9ZX35_9BACI|nr:hypothetical protein [Evansella vedderi]